MNTNNLWLGGNELVIVFRNGTHHVMERYEDYDDVFTGSYQDCVAYVNERYVDYLESIIG